MEGQEPRSRWTKEEDQRLLECKSRNPDLSWEKIAKLAGLNRTGKSCWGRWKNYLDPNVKREEFSQEEDDSIICFQLLYGNSWASIAAHLPGRTDNDVKNRWYNHLKEKKLGRSTDHNIDPDASASASSSSIPTLVSDSQTEYTQADSQTEYTQASALPHQPDQELSSPVRYNNPGKLVE